MSFPDCSVIQLLQQPVRPVVRFASLGLLLLAPLLSWAGGAYYAPSSLENRSETLSRAPYNSFGWEMARLVEVKDQLRSKSVRLYDQSEDEQFPYSNAGEQEKKGGLEVAGLNPVQVRLLEKARLATSGEKAYQSGEGLPPAVRLYTAGAVQYRFGKDGPGTPDYERMLKYFQAVLDLPPKQGERRAVWAAYMLGRIHAEASVGAWLDDEEPQKHFKQALFYFNLARERARAGDYDPEGLGVASYGEEARIYLAVPGYGFCDPMTLLNASEDAAECYAGIPAENYKKAIGLYAEQTSRGENTASLSLLASYIAKRPALLREVSDDPLSLRVLISYTLNTTYDGWEKGGRGRVVAILQALTDVVEKKKAGSVQGSDLLAAMAYRLGQYPLAERLIAGQETPEAYWVRAKLALQRGDREAAAQAYTRALKVFPVVDEPGAHPTLKRLRSEQGTLALARGEYLQSFSLFVDQALDKEKTEDLYFDDSALEDAIYIAERVLLTDELKKAIDARFPLNTPTSGSSPKEGEWVRSPVADTLRYLLGRRLIREQRYEEALPYFPEPGSYYFTDRQAREHARQYVEQLKKAKNAWTSIGKAEALFEAAKIARKHGLEIMGYEQGPDNRFSDGNFSCCYTHSEDRPEEARYMTSAERERVQATAALPQRQFHYRYIAADLADQAADYVPPRSQAFAAMLCRANLWTRDREPEIARSYYLRYVRDGALVDFPFAYPCPEPSFMGARRRMVLDGWSHFVSSTRQAIPLRMRYIALLGILALALCGVLGVKGYRRYKASKQK